jgi:H+/Na+-translocating ferredoxin:NAD+ oxidoreductase subunit G
VNRRRFLLATGSVLVLAPGPGRAQEGLFMDADDAPRALFPQATEVTKRTVPATAPLQQQVVAGLGRPPSFWEPAYPIYTLVRGGERVGLVVIVEEIGKHRPITFAVGVQPDGAVRDIAVLAYREAYGGEVRDRRFLRQYTGKTLGDPLLPYRDIRNISGATLSVQATGRAARKAIAVLKAVGDLS